jgi:hypothetical protein
MSYLSDVKFDTKSHVIMMLIMIIHNIELISKIFSGYKSVL